MGSKGHVLDASVLVKCLFEEADSELARDLVSRSDWIAPELIFLEVANVASLRVRRGLSSIDVAKVAVLAVHNLVDTEPLGALAEPALELATEHGFSAYDAAYLALAIRENAFVLTADMKFARRAEAAGLSAHVRTLL